MKKITKILPLIMLALICYSCYYDKLDEIYPTTAYHDPCDTTLDTTYSGSIQLIVTYNCVTCHNSSNASGNILLDSYEAIKNQTAGTPTNNAMYNSIHGVNGGDHMPPTGTLPDCEIQRLDAWFKKGAPQ